MYSHEYSFLQISNKFPGAGHRYSLTFQKKKMLQRPRHPAYLALPNTMKVQVKLPFSKTYSSAAVFRTVLWGTFSQSKHAAIAGTLRQVSTINFRHRCFKESDILASLVAVATKDMNHVRTSALFHTIFSKLKPTSTAVARSSITTLAYKCCNVLYSMYETTFKLVTSSHFS